MRRAQTLALVLALVAGCSNLQGFGGDVPPLVTFQLAEAGSAAGASNLQIALVWGAQWLPEPFCVLPPADAGAAAVIAAGCRDSFGFVPMRVEANVPIDVGGSASIPLYSVPAADVLVGDLTERVAYGSFVLYDDVDGDGTLDLGRANHTASGGLMMMGSGSGSGSGSDINTRDVVYGASFVSMTAPDERVAYREGAFDSGAAFYPRSGCDAPPGGFSIVGAGGFSASAGIAAALLGQLPAENPAACSETDPAVGLTLTAGSAGVDSEEACVERVDDSSARYREPPSDMPDFTDRIYACTSLPSLGSDASSTVVQLVVSGRSDDSCVGLTHYVLTGCSTDPLCAVPAWDFSATPPSWWPCQ